MMIEESEIKVLLCNTMYISLENLFSLCRDTTLMEKNPPGFLLFDFSFCFSLGIININILYSHTCIFTSD